MAGDNRSLHPGYAGSFPYDALHTRALVDPRGGGEVSYWHIVSHAHSLFGLKSNLASNLHERRGTGDVTLLGRSAIRRAVYDGTLQPTSLKVQDALRNGLEQAGAFSSRVSARIGEIGLLGPRSKRDQLVLFLDSEELENWREQEFRALEESFGTEVRRHDEPVHLSLGRGVYPTDKQIEQLKAVIGALLPSGMIHLKGVEIG